MANKFYKNPNRNANETIPKYVPQYKIHDLEPHEHFSPKLPPNTLISKGSNISQKEKRTLIRQEPYADAPPNAKINSIPNVGNSSWSSAEEFPDMIIDPNAKMVDYSQESQEALKVLGDMKNSDEETFISSLYSLEENNFVLIVQGTLVCSGDLTTIESEVRTLLLGDDPIDSEDILVLKRSKIKIGVFID